MSFSYPPPPRNKNIFILFKRENTKNPQNETSVNKLTLCSTFSPDFNLSVFPFSSSSIFITVHCGVCSDHSLLIKDWVLFTHTPTTVLLFLYPLLFSCPSLPILSFFWEMMSVQVRYNYDKLQIYPLSTCLHFPSMYFHNVFLRKPLFGNTSWTICSFRSSFLLYVCQFSGQVVGCFSWSG